MRKSYQTRAFYTARVAKRIWSKKPRRFVARSRETFSPRTKIMNHFVASSHEFRAFHKTSNVSKRGGKLEAISMDIVKGKN